MVYVQIKPQHGWCFFPAGPSNSTIKCFSCSDVHSYFRKSIKGDEKTDLKYKTRRRKQTERHTGRHSVQPSIRPFIGDVEPRSRFNKRLNTSGEANRNAACCVQASTALYAEGRHPIVLKKINICDSKQSRSVITHQNDCCFLHKHQKPDKNVKNFELSLQKNRLQSRKKITQVINTKQTHKHVKAAANLCLKKPAQRFAALLNSGEACSF